MGSISGSAIANTVTTGSLTIPMMKQLGFKPEQAAGIEAGASTGGQIMPPIMGAGAFVMAEFTRTAYADIVWMSLVPALLYFGSVLLYVHILAVKSGIQGMNVASGAWQVIKDGVHFLLPLVIITALLVQNYSPVLVGVSGCAAVIAASLLRSHTRVNLQLLIDALHQGAILAIPITIACAVAGIVVGTIGQTGVGLQFTESVVGMSNGQLWLALILISIAALVLGMGLPATAAYIVLAVMTGPALQELGLTLITAHMIIFWLSQTSNVTPPIALAAFCRCRYCRRAAYAFSGRGIPSRVGAFCDSADDGLLTAVTNGTEQLARCVVGRAGNPCADRGYRNGDDAFSVYSGRQLAAWASGSVHCDISFSEYHWARGGCGFSDDCRVAELSKATRHKRALEDACIELKASCASIFRSD